MLVLLIAGLLACGVWAAWHNSGTHQAVNDRNAAAAQGNTSGANAAQKEADKESNAACLPIALAFLCLLGLFLLASSAAALGF